jgi:hypothetical protein
MAACELTLIVMGTGAATAETIPSSFNSFAEHHIFDEAEVIW